MPDPEFEWWVDSGDQFKGIMLFNWSPDDLAYMELHFTEGEHNAHDSED